MLNKYLLEEWQKKKKGKIHYVQLRYPQQLVCMAYSRQWLNIHDGDANTLVTYLPCYDKPDTSLASKNTIEPERAHINLFLLN